MIAQCQAVTFRMYLHYFLIILFVGYSECHGALTNTKDSQVITDDTYRKLIVMLCKSLGDSVKLPDQFININNNSISFNGSMTSATANFYDLNVPHTHVNMESLEFQSTITYETIKLHGNYSLYFDNDWVHADSADQFSVNVSSVLADTYMKLKLKNDNFLELVDIKIDYNASVKLEVNNLGGYKDVSDTLNKLINDLLPSALIFSKPEVQEEIKTNALEFGNNFLFNNMTLDDFIKDINNLINSSE